MLVQCWASVADAGPALDQYSSSISCFCDTTPVSTVYNLSDVRYYFSEVIKRCRYIGSQPGQHLSCDRWQQKGWPYERRMLTERHCDVIKEIKVTVTT